MSWPPYPIILYRSFFLAFLFIHSFYFLAKAKLAINCQSNRMHCLCRLNKKICCWTIIHNKHSQRFVRTHFGCVPDQIFVLLCSWALHAHSNWCGSRKYKYRSSALFLIKKAVAKELYNNFIRNFISFGFVIGAFGVIGVECLLHLFILTRCSIPEGPFSTPCKKNIQESIDHASQLNGVVRCKLVSLFVRTTGVHLWQICICYTVAIRCGVCALDKYARVCVCACESICTELPWTNTFVCCSVEHIEFCRKQ